MSLSPRGGSRGKWVEGALGYQGDASSWELRAPGLQPHSRQAQSLQHLLNPAGCTEIPIKPCGCLPGGLGKAGADVWAQESEMAGVATLPLTNSPLGISGSFCAGPSKSTSSTAWRGWRACNPFHSFLLSVNNFSPKSPHFWDQQVHP